jgi:hypothetical protein
MEATSGEPATLSGMDEQHYENLALAFVEDGRRPEVASLLAQADFLRDLAYSMEARAFEMERKRSEPGSTATPEGLLAALKKVYGDNDMPDPFLKAFTL